MYHEVEVGDQTATIHAFGECEGMESCTSFMAQVERIIAAGLFCIIDLRGVSYISGSFCRTLVSLFKQANEVGIRISLALETGSSVYQVLAATGIGQMVDLCTSPEVALKAETVLTE